MQDTTLALIICTISLVYVVESFGQEPVFVDGAGTEQPSVGPTAALTTVQGTFVADEGGRRILLYDGPSLENLVGERSYPENMLTIEQLIAVDGNLVAVDASGSHHGMGIQADYLSADAEWRLGYDAEREDDESVSVTSAAGTELTLRATNPEQNIVSWSYVGAIGGSPAFYWVEQSGGVVRALVGTPVDDEFEPIVEVNLSQFDYLLRDPVHVDALGQIWFISLDNGEWSRPVSSVATSSRNLLDESSSGDFFGDQQLTNGQPSDFLNQLERIADVQSGIRNDSLDSGRGLDDYEIIDRAMLNFADTQEFRLVVPEGLTREEIISRALAYYTVPYFYRTRNANDLGPGWEMPKNLIGQVSTWQTGFRYYWSGYMSPLRHQQGLIEGFAVGDIDTDHIISEGIVGCDCSGCVSAWLGIPRHTTSGFGIDEHDLFDPIDLSEAQSGDIFNRSGSHVRMLLNTIETSDGTLFRMIESAKSCDGVCIRIYSVEQLRNYQPLRYAHILDS